jgi:hypothetical protein
VDKINKLAINGRLEPQLIFVTFLLNTVVLVVGCCFFKENFKTIEINGR